MASLFFSYSHKDEALRDELEVHLSMLKRQGIIESWHDRRIGAGNEFESEISQELNNADIILLLISPYFLDSDYCYDIEMKRALERHESGDARVIPVILHPCDWHSAPFGKLMATPADGKPVSKHPNQHDAFLDIVISIRSVATELSGHAARSKVATPHKDGHTSQPKTELPRSSNLRISKDFTEQQKDDFIESTFEYISNFFEGSLGELSNRNPEITSKFKRIDTNHFTAVVYRNGDAVSQCKIWLGGLSSLSGGIAYSSNISSSDNSLNESLSVETDGHILFLKAMGISFMGRSQDDAQLSQEGAAEYFWELFIRQLQY
jgi:hypothetical protein